MDDRTAKRQRTMDPLGISPSEADILEMVAQRESFRQARRFAESDAIREELRSMGVELYDKEKQWKCSDGRSGSLFTAGSGETQLTDAEIQERIAEREEARSQKDFARADSVRDELRKLGVEVSDKEQCWRTASGRSGTYNGQITTNRNVSNTETIQKLVAERERLRAGREYDAADELRKELSAMGVEIYDAERTWRSADGQQGVIITGGAEGTCHLSNRDIEQRVQAREEARNNKDWGMADEIRAGLRASGVELMDQNKTWCTSDGRSGGYGGDDHYSRGRPEGRGAPQMGAVTRPTGAIGYSNSSPRESRHDRHESRRSSRRDRDQYDDRDDRHSSQITQTPSLMTLCTESIEALVLGREKARDGHRWEAADRIRQDLRAHGVDVWDKDKAWRANDGRHGRIDR